MAAASAAPCENSVRAFFSFGRGAALLALEVGLELGLGHLVDAEGREQLAEDVVRGQVPELQRFTVRHDLRLHEAPEHVSDLPVLLAPLEHGVSPRTARPTRFIHASSSTSIGPRSSAAIASSSSAASFGPAREVWTLGWLRTKR
jgi:hypothetical protein